MFLIAGLGNPGAKYSGTRHNVGFQLIEKLCDKLSVKMKAGKGPFFTGKSNYKRKKIILLQPTTFMNNSGRAVQQAAHWFKIPSEHCLICYDDLNLRVGSIRLRRGGSAGGHNGIKDIIQKLGTESFPRLRIGIGNDFIEGQQSSYVLSQFSKDQLPLIEEAVDNAVKAALQFVTKGVETAMNHYN